MTPSEKIRKKVGNYLFNRWLLPPPEESGRLLTYSGDYGHALHYEELFAGDGKDVEFAIRTSQIHGGRTLDLAGGAGRLSTALTMRGLRVTLVDSSSSMLAIARAKRAILSRSARALFEIYPQDISLLHLDTRFNQIFCLNNVFEHFSSDSTLLKALRHIAQHLEPSGNFYTDVHFPLYLEKDPTWKKGIWRYNQDKTVNGTRYRVWSRTLPKDETNEVICDHALSTDLKTYSLLRTTLYIRSIEDWKSAFEMAGFKIISMSGDWEGRPVSPELPKLIWHLKLA